MLGRHPMLAILSLAASFALVPSQASATPESHSHHAKPRRVARIADGTSPAPAGAWSRPRAKPCTRAPVQVVSGAESATLSLTKCDGEAIPSSVDELAAMARPGAKATRGMSARGHVDPRLVERLGKMVDNFRKDGETPRVVLVSGYRPRSTGSYHSSGRALDFRIEGVKNEDIVAFCKTLPDTGCGFYPNDSFVHVDVRDHGVGHVSWIDTSRAGEPPRYVSTWPETSASNSKLPPLPAGAHSAAEASEPSLAMRRFQ